MRVSEIMRLVTVCADMSAQAAVLVFANLSRANAHPCRSFAFRPISSTVANVATSGYIHEMETGIRKLKDNLSRYIRRIEAGERISVTAHGRVVAELVPPGGGGRTSPGSRWHELTAPGIAHPRVEAGDPFEDWPDIRLPPGTPAELIDSDRGEA